MFAAQQRIADLARAAKAAGDKRTLAQLRADIALDLLLAGVVPGDARLGDAPGGKLHVIVDLSTILPQDLVRQTAANGAGAAFGLGEVPGLGFLSADQVRAVALQAGSTWARLVTDPLTGQVIDAASTYRAPAGMARLVRGRDHTCRAPGDCGIPASEADLDHDTDYQAGATEPSEGATHPDNLHLMHRGHHNTKTGRFWTSRQHLEDASITWHTLTRRLRTTAHNHRQAHDHAPPWVSGAERQLGLQLARLCEHDLTASAFTDLQDFRLLTDRDEQRIHFDLEPDWPDIDFPDRPPPF